MNERKKIPGVADYIIAHRRRRKDTFLDEIDRLIDWKPIEKLLAKKIRRNVNAVGNPAYPALAMFKILLVQRWYNLSDDAVEDALSDRLSFVRFVGLSLDDDDVPDATTICRFRNALLEKNVAKRLFDKLNHQLQRSGVLVREGAILDASVVSSSCRPQKVIDIMPEDREGDDEDEDDEPVVSYSIDKDAAWLRKGSRAWYGYKIHLAASPGKGFILGGHVTPANRSDVGELPKLLDDTALSPGMHVYADKGYSSELNRFIVTRRGYKDGIMAKAGRNRILTTAQQAANRAISAVRSTVERVFGTLKRTYGFARARYLGLAKVEQEFLLNAMAFNLKKAWSLAGS